MYMLLEELIITVSQQDFLGLTWLYFCRSFYLARKKVIVLWNIGGYLFVLLDYLQYR